MAKKFIISTDILTSDQEKAIIRVISDGRGWWHRLPNFWLVKSNKEDDTAAKIRDALRDIIGKKRFIVIEVQHIQWSGMFINNDTLKESEWLHKNWESS